MLLLDDLPGSDLHLWRPRVRLEQVERLALWKEEQGFAIRQNRAERMIDNMSGEPFSDKSF